MTKLRTNSRAMSLVLTVPALTLSLVTPMEERIVSLVATQNEAPANPPTQVEHL